MEYLLIDGFNMAFRNFYAVPELTRADGFPTNMLHGWVKMIWKLQDSFPNAKLIMVFDSEKKSFRDELFPDYKANRTDAPDTFKQQIPEVFKLTEYMGIPILKKDGYEADDLLAAYAIELQKSDATVYIVSADKDIAQCLNENIKQLLPPPTANPKLGWRTFLHENILEKFGVTACQIPDYLAIMGDNSDNIPGITGVGPKTAAKWLSEFKTLEDIIAHADELKPERLGKLVAENAEQLRRNLKLTTLQTDISELHPADCSLNPERLFEYLQSMELKGAHTEAIRRYEKNEKPGMVSTQTKGTQFDLFEKPNPPAPSKPSKPEQLDLF